MADHSHDITMPARLGPQNAKTILGIMVRDALDEAGKNLLRLILRRAFHGRLRQNHQLHACHSAQAGDRVATWPRDLASRLKPFQGNPTAPTAVLSNLRKRLQLTAEMR